MIFSKKNNASILKTWQAAKFDKSFFLIIVTVCAVGFFIFLSASLGLHARGDASVLKLVVNQVIFGLIGGSLVGLIVYRLPLVILQKHAIAIFIASVATTMAVFIPGLGFSYGGATRWLDLGPLTLQPAEILKLASVIVSAAWFSFLKRRSQELKLGLGGILGIILLCVGVLLLQPDTGTAVVIVASAGSIYLVSGAKWKHILLLIIGGSMFLGLLITVRPYVKDRLITFINPASDPLGAGYQTQQSMIAVGSGGLFGRGPGQSIQKFNYLPEPISDSIFAVFAEEYGFFGTFSLLALYAAIGYFGYRIANRLRPGFNKLLVVGLVTMIMIQSILNIGAMVGVFPLSGMPLIFVSHGGTAMMFSLIAVALVLNASAEIKPNARR